jgi:hypothetical protein
LGAGERAAFESLYPPQRYFEKKRLGRRIRKLPDTTGPLSAFPGRSGRN